MGELTPMVNRLIDGRRLTLPIATTVGGVGGLLFAAITVATVWASDRKDIERVSVQATENAARLEAHDVRILDHDRTLSGQEAILQRVERTLDRIDRRLDRQQSNPPPGP